MTTRTGSQSGPISAFATWGGATFVDQDYIVDDFALTLDVSHIVGDGTANLVLDLTNGSISIDAGITLTVGGYAKAGVSPTNVGTVLTLAAGGGIEFDGASGVTPKWEFGTDSQITIAGTSENFCELRTKSGTAGSPGYLTGTGNGPFVNIDYAHIADLGDATIPGLTIGTGGGLIRIRHSTIDNCGPFPSLLVTADNTDIEISDCVYTNVRKDQGATAYPFDIQYQGDNSNGSFLFERNLVMSMTVWFVSNQIVRNNYFHDSPTALGGTESGEFSGNFIRKVVNNPTGWLGDYTRNALYVGVAALGMANVMRHEGVTVTGNVCQSTSSSTAPFLWQNEGGALTEERYSYYYRNIAVKTAGFSRTMFWLNSNVSVSYPWLNVSYVENNTICIWGNPAVLLGESIGIKPDSVRSFKGNLCVNNAPAGDTGYTLWNSGRAPADTPVDSVAAADITHNNNYRMGHTPPGTWVDCPGATTIGDNTPYFTPFSGSTVPGANDKRVHPRFVDGERNFFTWDIFMGGNGSEASLLARIQANPMLTETSLVPWITAGYQPTNEALRGADHNGGDIGAVPMGAVAADYLGFGNAIPIRNGPVIPASDIHDHSVLLRIVDNPDIGTALATRKFAVVAADRKTELGYGSIYFAIADGLANAAIRFKADTWPSSAQENDVRGYLCFDNAKSDRELTLDAVANSVGFYLTLEESSGPVVDWSANGNVFVRHGSPAQIDGVVGKAVNLNGVDTWFSCLDPAVPYVKRTGGSYRALSQYTCRAIGKMNGNSNYPIFFANNNGNSEWNLRLSGLTLKPESNHADTVQATSAIPLVIGTWAIVHFVWTGTQLEIYVDGVLTATVPCTDAALLLDGALCTIGSGDGSLLMNGALDEFLLDAEAWSADRVAFDVANINDNASTITLGNVIVGPPATTVRRRLARRRTP